MASPTIRDVAREAGVGVGTVSRVLNNSPQVSPGTRQRVLEAIQRLDFRPNQFARQLSRRTRLRSLGVISPFISDYSFMARLQGVQRALDESEIDYDIVFYHVHSVERFRQQLKSIVEHSTVQALLLIAIEPMPDDLLMLQESGLAFVGISDYPVEGWPCISMDNVMGGELATEYLLKLGHKKIAYVGDQFSLTGVFTSISTSETRFQGYQRALYKANVALNPDYVQLGQQGKDAAYQLALRLLAQADPPTAIFCTSDVQALGCLAAIRDYGLSVPKDMSLIGFDDVEFSALIGLTTVRQHLDEAGYLAMRYLLKQAGDPLYEDEPLDEQNMQPPPFAIIERQTTSEMVVT